MNLDYGSELLFGSLGGEDGEDSVNGVNGGAEIIYGGDGDAGDDVAGDDVAGNNITSNTAGDDAVAFAPKDSVFSNVGFKGSGSRKSRVKHNIDIDSIHTQVFDARNECHFAKGANPICSPKHVINHMKEFAKSKNRHDIATGDEKKLLAGMKELLNCQSESCILKRSDFVDFAKIANVEDILNEFFKPSGPALNFGLLSNFHIDDVLDQFEDRFANRKFLHIPFQMRDFETIGTQLATVDLAEKFKTYDTFGVVINTDLSSGKGIHWFCIFGENYKTHVALEYFNSSGKQPLVEIQTWLQKTKNYLEMKMKIPVTVFYTTGIMFQNDDHSCGLYSLAYIWLRLERVPPKWFNTDNFNDKKMHDIRKNMFRWEA